MLLRNPREASEEREDSGGQDAVQHYCTVVCLILYVPRYVTLAEYQVTLAEYQWCETIPAGAN